MKTLFSAVIVVLLACGASWAGPFVNEPADHWPDQWQLPTGQWITNEWVTPPPYQRNIHLTFDNGLDPWQFTYQGTDDDVLKVSDYLGPGAAFVWYDNDAAFQPGGVARRFGLIGIDNRRGADNVISGISFSIDNWDAPSAWKHVWKEIIHLAGPGVIEEEQFAVPSGFTSLEQTVFSNDLGDNWAVVDVAWKVYPNPPWEQITIIVRVPAGSYILFDEIHFATECVPEPATVTLWILGGLGFAGLRRKR